MSITNATVFVLKVENHEDRCILTAAHEDGRVLYHLYRAQNADLSYWPGRYCRLSLNERLEILHLEEPDSTFNMEVDKAAIGRAFKDLVDRLALIKHPGLHESAQAVLSNDRFKLVPSSLKYHTAIERKAGGLIYHTANMVCTMATLLDMPIYKHIDSDIALTAAYWHDVGKIHMYDPRPKDDFFEYNMDARMVQDVSLSAMEWWAVATQLSIDKETLMAVSHCIIASHGFQHWGSPVEPKTPEAKLLHQCDMLSGHIADSNAYYTGGANE
jgi:hypothetical protein